MGRTVEQDTGGSDGRAAVRGTALLGKALDVVDLLAASEGRVKLRDLSLATGFAKPTLHRILAALVARGLVVHDPRDHAYALGPRFSELAAAMATHSDLIAASTPVMRQVAVRFGERVNLAVLEGVAARVVAVSAGLDRHGSAASGGLKPLSCTALGKALLAHCGDAARESLLARIRLEPLTPASHRTRTALAADLHAIRMRGFARDDEEVIQGTRCVGVPVMGADGTAIAAISVTVPVYRLPDWRLEEIAATLRDAAREIAGQIRATPAPGPASASAAAPGGLDAVRTFSVVGVQRVERGVVVADGPGARLVFVADDGTQTVWQGQTPLRSIWATGPEVVALGAAGISRLALTEAGFRLLSHIPLAQPDADAVAQDHAGNLLVGAGRNVIGIRRDGGFDILAQDRAAGGGFGRVRGCLAYGAEGGLRGLDGRMLVRTAHVCRSFAELPDGRIAIVADETWSLRLTAPDRDTDAVRHPLPVLRPTAVCLDAPGGRLLLGSDRISLSASQLDLSPRSGSILRLDPFPLTSPEAR